ncbi:aspartoacylase [Scytonema sp. UIC 10036]|uniref:aspartoacylase n=1 Tax=Scytonema sp. UIC 10036 TaxID=2304196 RepID=UPI0012DA2516|nr:aspartoacylase [Scytonema sp. UIC 10036]MUG93230.1 aspartoacylase [Scytonema sp. UIC 10036]
MNQIERVAIVGGTHGNELTGAYLVKKFERYPHFIKRSSFESLTLLANPQAFLAQRRYIERDLNRCFTSENLSNATPQTYEDRQAQAINQILGPKGNSKVDVVIDLHSTTANMGLTIIPINNSPFNLRLAAYLCSINSLIKIYRWQESGEESPFLRSICQLGCTIEVGSIAQGVLDAKLFQQTEELTYAVLDYLENYKQGNPLSVPSNLTLYQCIKIVDYPKNEQGELQAMIHPQLQFRDYQPLNPGEPMFLTFDGQAIPYKGQSTVYPVFINEAAYYEKGIAMCLTQKQQFSTAIA